ncbi:hypothetical protein F4780DRAFT_727272 [Xylariomycetidae sp. FL0641]|nr:hypothetical protein F4780DRAFT_727272 [Xylariomycetidae sp. FL0641]
MAAIMKFTAALLTLASTTSALPTPRGPASLLSTRASTIAQRTTTQRTPTLHALHPATPSQVSDPSTTIDLERTGDASVTEQVAVFSGVPANASACYLFWSQADAGARTFSVDGSGLVDVAQLASVPATFSSAGVAALAANPVVEAAADFTSWDAPEYGATEHRVGAVDCMADMAFLLRLRGTNGDGHVLMEQDASNGFYIQYDL